MFRIRIRVHPVSMTGLSALDFRRRFNLRPESRVTVVDDSTVCIDVPESFARLHFGPDDICLTRYLTADRLSAGDLADCGHGQETFALLNRELEQNPERVRELWLAATPG